MTTNSLTQIDSDDHSAMNITISPDISVKSVEMPSKSAHLLCSVPLHDIEGKLNVIIRGDRLLDIDELNRKLKRDLVPLNAVELSGEAARCDTISMALPGWVDMPVLLDKAIFELPDVVLKSVEDTYFKLSIEDYRKLSADSPRLEGFCAEVQYPENTSIAQDDDAIQITSAIKRFTQLRIKQRLLDTLDLPPLPTSANRIFELRANPDASVMELAEVVEMDPALSAQVVSWASSSFYAAPGKISSVRDAIVRVLGFDLVLNLALGLSLGKTFSPPDRVPGTTLSYWQQSVWMASTAGALIRHIDDEHRPTLGLCYLSGLLHNIGFLVLAHVFPPHFITISRFVEANPHLDHSLIDNYLLGISREQMGSCLMHGWQLPAEIVAALRFQKQPDYDGEFAVYPLLLFVARQLLIEEGIFPESGGMIPPSVFEKIKLKEDDARAVISDLRDSADEIKKVAGMLESF